MNWVLYGATGITGTLIAEVAVARGHRPVLTGRSADRVRPLAERLDLPWRAVDPADAAGLERLAGEASLILLAASPFESTSEPVLRACLATGRHYLDIANDPAIFAAAYAQDDAARRSGSTVLPGVGFGVVATDTLARHVVDRLPGTVSLELAMFAYTAGTSPGARANTLQALARGGLVRRAGQLTRRPLGSGAHRIGTPTGARTVMPAALGDLESAYRTTGVPDITASVPIGLPPLLARLVLPGVGLAARSRLLQRRAAAGTAGPLPPEDPGRHGYTFAVARDAGGRVAAAWLETGEGYAFTAQSAVRAVEAVLADPVPGAHSPGALLGADFPLSIPGTQRFDGPRPAVA